MTEFLTTSTFFGVFLSLITYHIGIFVRKKTGLTFLTPLVTATAIVIVVLGLTGIDYEAYISQMYAQGLLPCKDKREGKRRIEAFRKELL